LRAKNIALQIELGGINTMKDSIQVLAAFVQEESRFKSENIKWGIHQSMKQGNVKLNYSQFLGYTKDESGHLVIVPEEAETVREIFDLYIKGYGYRKIKKYLETNGIKTVTGKAEWSTSTIDRMLSNEKYLGNILFQKTYTANFLKGKQMRNDGKFEQYYVENNHEAIISKEVFAEVQIRKTEC
jgi:site-specific DNA recombinase